MAQRNPKRAGRTVDVAIPWPADYHGPLDARLLNRVRTPIWQTFVRLAHEHGSDPSRVSLYLRCSHVQADAMRRMLRTQIDRVTWLADWRGRAVRWRVMIRPQDTESQDLRTIDVTFEWET